MVITNLPDLTLKGTVKINIGKITKKTVTIKISLIDDNRELLAEFETLLLKEGDIVDIADMQMEGGGELDKKKIKRKN